MTSPSIPASVQWVRPQLQKAVKASSTSTAARFVVFLVLILTFAVVGYLWLTTVVNEDAYRMRALRDESKVLSYQISNLRSQIAQESSASSLALKAQKLHMTPNTSSAQLSLKSGKVIGKATVTTGAEVPSVNYRSQDDFRDRRSQLEAKERQDQARKKAEAAAKAAAEKQAAQLKAEADAALAKAQAAQETLQGLTQDD